MDYRFTYILKIVATKITLKLFLTYVHIYMYNISYINLNVEILTYTTVSTSCHYLNFVLMVDNSIKVDT
jgi:hypothetical protein